MKTTFHILPLVLTTLFFSCNGQTTPKKSKLDGQDTSTETKTTYKKNNPIDFVKNYNGENNKLFAFVGQKISVDVLPHRDGSMDGGFKAKYKILQEVFGNFSLDTIEFVAYDHYGVPPFSKFDNVLLFVSSDSGTYFHQKYMYNDVYLTKDGRWAGCYVQQDYEHDNNKKTSVKPIIIDFEKEVSYPTKIIRSDSQVITVSYPKKYFKTIGDKAIAVYGNYVEDLFILKRDGYLTAREIFKDGKLQ
ncbi:hypothetical protein [Flectobacillus major]|uniref:hypothetical protein n=1 Tax=Flectobacillus major TaxID=103 RepID=UPI00041FD173|nr:hypothetical protein [Flectobacillus major]